MIAEIFAGTLGGVAVVLVGHPFDTTKTRLQTAPEGFYKNTIDCIKKTVRWEGFRGFYRGMHSPLAGQMFFRACSFSTFHNSVRSLKVGESISRPSLVIAGGVTGFVISFIESPIDLVKTRLQTQIFYRQIDTKFVPKYTTMKGCINYLIKNYGVKSLWQGLSATIARNIPGNALFFPVNELMKEHLAAREGVHVKQLSFQKNLFCGSLAGLSYWVLTYPLDVIKAKMQANEFGRKLSWWKTAKQIYKHGGLRAFGRGFAPCAARAVPACGAMFATVDLVRNNMFTAVI